MNQKIKSDIWIFAVAMTKVVWIGWCCRLVQFVIKALRKSNGIGLQYGYTLTQSDYTSQRLRQSVGTCYICSFHLSIHTTWSWVKWNRVNELFHYEFNSTNCVDWIWFSTILLMESNENKDHHICAVAFIFIGIVAVLLFLLASLSGARVVRAVWPCCFLCLA